MQSLNDYDALMRDRARERGERQRAHVVAVRRRDRAVARAVAARRLDLAVRALQDAAARPTPRTDAQPSGAQPQRSTVDARSAADGRLALV